MASLDTTPVRELTDQELRKRLLALGYDVPVSVNREFLVRKLENASAGGGGGSKSNKRHSVAASSPVSNSSNQNQGGRGSPSAVRKRKSLGTPMSSSNHGGGLRNNAMSPAMSPLASSSPMVSSPVTPSYSNSPSIATPTTPSPFVSRLNTPSQSSTPLNNGESGSHSPRFMNYYNFFKTGGDGAGNSRSGGGGTDEVGNYGYGYNRSIRLSAPPSSFSPVTSVSPPTRSTERNGYAGGSTGNSGGEADWFGGHMVSKILVISFVLFFAIIGLVYVRQIYGFDPRGLTSGVGGDNDNKATVKEASPPPPPPKKVVSKLPPSSMTFPVCGLKGVDPEACIPKDVVKNSRTLFNTLKEELIQRSRSKGCRPDIQDRMSLLEAKTVLYRLTDLRKADVDAAFTGMLLLVTENPGAGVRLDAESFGDKEITSKDVESLDFALSVVSATDVSSDFICGVIAFTTSVAMYLLIAVASACACFGGWKLVLYYRRKKKTEEDEVFKFVEKVLELLYQQYELSERSDGLSCLAVNHIRDELVPPKERQKKEALWNKVADYISNHESRVREEIQHLSGEEFKVWRWLPSASPLVSKRFSTANNKASRYTVSTPMPPLNVRPSTSTSAPSPISPVAGPSTSQNHLYPSLNLFNEEDDDNGIGTNGGGDTNKWQGQAFETCEGSPNALPSTPTTCLKIRHMFSERDGPVGERTRVEKVILEKCRNARIMHIGIEPASVEGCVYVRCLTKDDARAAFQSLHGWWFDGHLLSVKFLREERYFSRFPEAKSCKEPLRA
ncbi:Inner nuclear membrane protein Man1 [Orchesella cincta]|uniref:Inner nuclear membrane protein Man1 n=1 Tax=Orchesella cincta TaxID=48709 RepID=A0A1D2MHW5_ORCCI|nr:Inner nuclear membrane protein Man1 [Orchesella cincta]